MRNKIKSCKPEERERKQTKRLLLKRPGRDFKTFHLERFFLSRGGQTFQLVDHIGLENLKELPINVYDNICSFEVN